MQPDLLRWSPLRLLPLEASETPSLDVSLASREEAVAVLGVRSGDSASIGNWE